MSRKIPYCSRFKTSSNTALFDIPKHVPEGCCSQWYTEVDTLGHVASAARKNAARRSRGARKYDPKRAIELLIQEHLHYMCILLIVYHII